MKFKILNLDEQPDSTGEVIDPAGLTFREDVLVTLNFSDEPRDILGTAKLERKEDGLYAEFTPTPDWAHDEASLKLLYPAVSGVVLDKQGMRLTKTVIQGLGLSTNMNADHRIRRVGEQE